MGKYSKRNLLSLLFVSGTILGWGLGCFLINWRAWRDNQDFENPAQPLSVSIILCAIGNLGATAVFLLLWPSRPIIWIKTGAASWSFLAGVLQCIGEYEYTVSANEGLPAVIGGPLVGLHVLVPPLWYWLYYGICCGIRTFLGFIFSMGCLLLYSGIFSSGSSYEISFKEWLAVLCCTLGWGGAMIAQGEAVKDINFKQFTQVLVSYTVGYTICSLVLASMGVSDVMDPSNWIPFFGANRLLMILSVFFASLGSGFFFVCLYYADDANLMVAWSSLCITIPPILGISVLHEVATWDVILALFFALTGMIILSFEADEAQDGNDNSSQLPHISIHPIEYTKMQAKSDYRTTMFSEASL